MNDRRRILIFSVVIMAGGMFSATTVAITVLYQTAFEQARVHLVEIAKGQTGFMEAVAKFDAIHSRHAHPNGAGKATLA